MVRGRACSRWAELADPPQRGRATPTSSAALLRARFSNAEEGRTRSLPPSDISNGQSQRLLGRPACWRVARSVPDARAIADALLARGVKLALGSSVYDPADPMGKMFFNILATFAEFEADLIRLRTREGMAVARRSASLPGRRTALTTRAGGARTALGGRHAPTDVNLLLTHSA